MARTNKLTDREIKAEMSALKRHDKPRKLFDGGGLFLLIQPPKLVPQGRKVPTVPAVAYWRLKYRMAGVEKLLSCGVYPEVALAKARSRRDNAREQLRDGKDPSRERKSARIALRAAARNTFRAVAAEWIELHKGWSDGYRKILLGRLVNHVYRDIGDEPISSINSPRLLELLKRIERAGSSDTARRVRTELDRIFRYAQRTLLIDSNPVPHPEVLSPHKKTPFASIKEPAAIGGLMRAIRGYEGTPTVKNALQLAPLVFVRPGELRSAVWREMDLDNGMWTIPADRMKMVRKFMVPLSAQAMGILRAQHAISGNRKFVFPSIRKPNQSGLSNNTILAALQTLGYGDVMTGHGFRHMASTILHESNKFRSLAIERQLAHVDGSVRGIYNAAEYIDERTVLMQWWADHLDALSHMGKVISIDAVRNAA
jgi:integrase